MKSSLLMMVLLGLGVAVWCAPALAAEDEDTKPQGPGREGSRARVERERDPVGEEIAFTEALRDAVLAELHLDEEQEATVSRLFAEHLEAVHKLTEERPDKEEADSDAERIRELEREARAAREAGDREEARRLYQELRQLRQHRGGADPANLARLNQELTRQVGEALNEEQRAHFQRLFHQVRERVAQGGPIRQLMRGVRRAGAELKLDDEQREAVNTIVRDAIKELDRPQENPEAFAELMAHLRPKLEEELGPELAGKFFAVLEKERERIKAEERRPPRPHGQPSSEESETEGEEPAEGGRD